MDKKMKLNQFSVSQKLWALVIGLLAGLLLGASAWKLNSALEQPLKLTQEQLLDVPAGATPTGQSAPFSPAMRPRWRCPQPLGL